MGNRNWIGGKSVSLKQDIRSVSYLKSRAADLLAQINLTRRPVVITQNGQPRAVLQDPESYERMRDALAMLKIAAVAEADVRAGRVEKQSEVFALVRSRLKARRSAHARNA